MATGSQNVSPNYSLVVDTMYMFCIGPLSLLKLLQDVCIFTTYIIFSRGYADGEIEALFAKYDIDGDRVLDKDEQIRMQEDLNTQKVIYIRFQRGERKEEREREVMRKIPWIFV